MDGRLDGRVAAVYTCGMRAHVFVLVSVLFATGSLACSGATGDANIGGGSYDSAIPVDAHDDASDDAAFALDGDTAVKDDTRSDGAAGRHDRCHRG